MVKKKQNINKVISNENFIFDEPDDILYFTAEKPFE